MSLTLVYVCCAWLCGIYFGSRWSVSNPYLWLAVPAFLFAIWLLRRQYAKRFAATIGLFFVLGILRMGMAIPQMDADSVAHYHNQVVSLTGTVVNHPDIRDSRVGLILSADALTVGSQHLAVDDNVLINSSLYPRFQYGDYLHVDGYLQLPPVLEDFSYRDYLARQGIFSLMSYPRITLLEQHRGNVLIGALYSIREKAQSIIGRILPDPEAALLSGVLLGIYRGLPDDLMDSFNATGTSHIIVISGFNITILAALQLRVFNQLLSRHWAVCASIMGIALYTMLVGADAAVVRAAVMGGTVFLAVLVGRRSDALNSLAIAALLLTLVNPLSLWDISFQLSAGATLGLVLFASSLYQQVQSMLPSGLGRSVAPLIKDSLTATLAAQVFTLPLILYYFRRISLIMPVANILILPAQPPLLVSGAAALLVGWIWLPAGQFFGGIAWLFLTYTIRIVELLGSLPLTSVEIGHLPASLLWGYYLLVIVILWLKSQDEQRLVKLWQMASTRLSARIALATLLLACLAIWSAALSLPDGRLHVRFLNVGQGDAILITLPDGRQILIDGGPSPTALLSEVGRAMPFWDHEIELVVLSHPDEDHLLGLISVLERYRVGQVLDSIIDNDSELSSQWQQLIRGKGIPAQKAVAGMYIDFGQGIHMDVLHPQGKPSLADGKDINSTSTVLRLVWGEISFLFTGDLETKGELDLLRSGQQIDSTVLKVSHHGAKEATSAELLEAVSPQLAVISVGDNRFGHPTRATLNRLSGSPVWRTDIMGTIDVQTDGVDCWVGQVH